MAAGNLAGRRVLDIGCGTGTLAIELGSRHGCRVWGIDPSQEMLAVAKSKGGVAARFKRASAEKLPFKDAWFERATMVSVAHHLDRPWAFPEAARVLDADGRLVVSNPDPDGFPQMWLMRWFPELLEREQARIPNADDLRSELEGSGFRSVEVERLAVSRRFSREEALRKVRGKHVSSFDLLSEDEYRAGLDRVERELPDPVEYELRSLLLVARR